MADHLPCPHCDTDLQNGFCEPCDRLIECCFPGCGCDGARLCMAENGASEYAGLRNVEGMWRGRTREQRRAAMGLMHDLSKEADNA